ncbi:hypothetical protein H0H93_004001 [Arthromyces matolae]|nr:hypothetical protein H0H93_004001 [Arthromyces matolae]
MFSNVLRLAVSSCRTSLPVFHATRAVARFPPVPATSFTMRALSTSKPVWRDFQRTENPESDTIFVGNLPYSATEEDLREKFAEFGIIKSLRLAYDSQGRQRGFAHVQYENLGDSVAAYKSIKEEPLFLFDRDLRVDYGSRNKKAYEPSDNLYFHNFNGGENELREIANDVNALITDIFFLRDRRTNAETGSGFIRFASVEDATLALEKLDGRAYGEESLRIRYATPRRDPASNGERKFERRGGRDNRDRYSRDNSY